MSEAQSAGPDQGHEFPLTTSLLCSLVACRLLISASKYPDAGYFMNGALALLLVLMLYREPERFRFQGTAIALGLFLYFLAAVVSIPFSVMPGASFHQLLLHLGDFLLLMAVLGAGKNRRRPLAITMLIAVALSCLFALRQWSGGFERTLASIPNASEFLQNTLKEARVFGFTSSPDLLAAGIAGVIPLALSFALTSLKQRPGNKNRRAKIALCLVALLLFGGALFLTRSLGGCLAAGGGIAFWLFFQALPKRTKGFKRREILIAAAVVAMTALAGLLVIHLRGGKFFDFENRHNPVTRRLDNWSAGIKIGKEFPVTGAGFGQYGLAAYSHRSVEGNEAKHAHNLLIESLAETGPLGLLGVLLILAGFFKCSIERMRRKTSSDEPGQELLSGYLAGAAAIALHCLIDYDWRVPEVAAIFWIGLAFALMPDRSPAEPSPALSFRRRRWLSAAAAAALIVTALAEFHQGRRARLFAEAGEAAEQGDWETVQIRAQKAIALSDADDEVHVLLAQASIELAPDREQGLSAALSHLERAIELNPKNPFHHLRYGKLQMPLDPEKAGKSLSRALSLYPNSMEINLVWGHWLGSRGRYEEAEQALLHAVRCGYANSEPIFELGLLYQEMGNTKKAEEQFKRAIAARPFNPGYVRFYARWLLDQARPDEARALLEKYSLPLPEKDGARD